LSERRPKIKEDGTLPASIGTGKPIRPNDCRPCAKHADFTCWDVKTTTQKEKP